MNGQTTTDKKAAPPAPVVAALNIFAPIADGATLDVPNPFAEGPRPAGVSVSARLQFPADANANLPAYDKTETDTGAGDWWQVAFPTLELGRTGGTLSVTGGGANPTRNNLRTPTQDPDDPIGDNRLPAPAPAPAAVAGAAGVAAFAAPTYSVSFTSAINRLHFITPVIVALVRVTGMNRKVVDLKEADVKPDDTFVTKFVEVPAGRYMTITTFIARDGTSTWRPGPTVVVP